VLTRSIDIVEGSTQRGCPWNVLCAEDRFLMAGFIIKGCFCYIEHGGYTKGINKKSFPVVGRVLNYSAGLLAFKTRIIKFLFMFKLLS
jgi:hypothetical protein